MLDPWIIEEIKKREKWRKRSELPHLEIPLHRWEDEEEYRKQEKTNKEKGQPKRGVVIVKYDV